MGRGPTCIRADSNSEKRFVMRFRGTDPREDLRNMIMIDMGNKNSLRALEVSYPGFKAESGDSPEFQKYRRDLGFTITETTSLMEYRINGYAAMLSAGFVYDFQVVGAEKKAPAKITAFYRCSSCSCVFLSLYFYSS